MKSRVKLLAGLKPYEQRRVEAPFAAPACFVATVVDFDSDLSRLGHLLRYCLLLYLDRAFWPRQRHHFSHICLCG